jgi:predicted permease
MTLRDLSLRLRALLRPRRADRDLGDELAFHLAAETEKLVASGLSLEAARRQAAARFGSVALAADRCRDARGLSAIHVVTRDAATDGRFALRQFMRRPLSALAMVGMLALGIGFSSAVFVVLSSLEISTPGGVRRDASLVRVRGIDRSRGPGRAIGREFPYAEYRDYGRAVQTFSAVAAWTSTDVVLDVGTGEPDLQSGAATFVTAAYFPVLGVRPILGAGLPTDAADDGAPMLAGVISHAVWERFYASAPDVIGRTLKVNDVAITITGVAPPRFVGARTGGSSARVWLPLNTRPVVRRIPLPVTVADDVPVFGVVARLRPGIDADQATAVVETMARPSRPFETASAGSRVSTDVVELLAHNYFPPSGETPGLTGRIVALSMPLLVLLITCTNVSTLLVGIAVTRRKEMAVRLSLGAHRRRIVRQLLTETALLALAGGALGLFVLWILLGAFDATFLDAPLLLDWRAGVFAFAAALLAGVVFGLSPALHGTRLALASVLQETDVTVSRSRLQTGLVIAQVAVTQPALLLMGAQLLQLRADLAERPTSTIADRILDVRFNTNPRYGAMDERREEALRRVGARLAALPGVVAVVPQDSGGEQVRIVAHPTDAAGDAIATADLSADVHGAPPGYFGLVGMSLLAGRDFTDADGRASAGVIIGAPLARRLWGTTDVIGRRLIAEGFAPGQPAMRSVVGVVDVPEPPRRRAAGIRHRIFVPDIGITSHLLVRTEGPAERAQSMIRAAAQAESVETPIVSARTLAEIEADARASTLQGITAAGGIGVLALLLAAVGLYSVVAVAAGQRVREIGIRTALGASRRRIVGMFLRKGLRASAVGLSLGLALSVVAVRLLAAAEGDAPPAGLLPLSAMVASIVMAVAAVAAWIPARRAARLDPLRALRVE